jgi:hypothetical protein
MDASTAIQPFQTTSSDTFMFHMSVYDIVEILHLIWSHRRYAHSLFLNHYERDFQIQGQSVGETCLLVDCETACNLSKPLSYIASSKCYTHLVVIATT